MKKATLTAALLISAVQGGANVLADDYNVDPSHTSIIFGVSHLGYSYTYGRFNKMSGNFSLGVDPARNQFQLAIDAASIDTNDPGRDTHLRQPDFFNVQQFPLITFQSTRVTPEQTESGIVLHVDGNLTMHGVTRPIRLDMQKLGEGPGPQGNDFRTGFICQHKLLRSEFGMKEMIPHIGDEIAITISLEGIRQEGER